MPDALLAAQLLYALDRADQCLERGEGVLVGGLELLHVADRRHGGSVSVNELRLRRQIAGRPLPGTLAANETASLPLDLLPSQQLRPGSSPLGPHQLPGLPQLPGDVGPREIPAQRRMRDPVRHRQLPQRLPASTTANQVSVSLQPAQTTVALHNPQS